MKDITLVSYFISITVLHQGHALYLFIKDTILNMIFII